MSIRNTRGFLLLNGLSPRDRRAVMLGLGILIPVAVYVLGLKPYLNALEDVRARVEAERDLLERELALLADAGRLPEEIQGAAVEASRYEVQLVQAASGELAEAALADILEEAAFRNRVLLEEIRGGELGRGEEPPLGLSVVRLHLRGESDLEGVLRFLDELEKNQLLLRIRGLALEPETARPEPAEGEEQGGAAVPTGVVDFQLIVDGFARVQEYGS